MTELPYPIPAEANFSMQSSPESSEAAIDVTSENALSLAQINLNPEQLTQNVHQVRHHESSPS